jgi:elongation factor 1-alpha
MYSFCPLSGFEGDIMIDKSANLSWRSSSTLLEALDTLQTRKHSFNKPIQNLHLLK